jgi:hypothetical protein
MFEHVARSLTLFGMNALPTKGADALSSDLDDDSG